MEVNEQYIIKLSREEAIALKKVLGKQTDNQYKSYGLNSSDIEMMNELYYSLPYEDE